MRKIGKIERSLNEFYSQKYALKMLIESEKNRTKQIRSEIADVVLPAFIALSRGDVVELSKCIEDIIQMKVN